MCYGIDAGRFQRVSGKWLVNQGQETFEDGCTSAFENPDVHKFFLVGNKILRVRLFRVPDEGDVAGNKSYKGDGEQLRLDGRRSAVRPDDVGIKNRSWYFFQDACPHARVVRGRDTQRSLAGHKERKAKNIPDRVGYLAQSRSSMEIRVISSFRLTAPP